MMFSQFRQAIKDFTPLSADSSLRNFYWVRKALWLNTTSRLTT